MFTDTSYMTLKGQMRHVCPSVWEKAPPGANKTMKTDSDPQGKQRRLKQLIKKPHEWGVKSDGGPSGIRTLDLGIKSPLL